MTRCASVVCCDTGTGGKDTLVCPTTTEWRQGKPRFYKVRRWIGPKQSVTYLFVGASAQGKATVNQALERAEVKGLDGLRKTDHTALRAHFGDNYEKVLMLKKGPVRYIRDDIRPDDTIDVLRAIIALHIAPQQQPSMHMWCTTQVAIGSVVLSNMLRDLFKERRVVNRLEFTSWCVRVFVAGQDIATSILGALQEESLLDWELIHIGLAKAIKKQGSQGLVIKQTIGASFKYGGRLIVVEPDVRAVQAVERAIGPDAALDVITREWRGSGLLEDYSPAKGIIELVLKSDTVTGLPKTLQDLYTGVAPEQPRVNASDRHFTAYDQMMRDFESDCSSTKDPMQRQQCFVSFIHMRVNDGGIPGMDVPLRTAFEHYKLDAVCPFARLHQGGRSVFKLLRKYFTDPNLDVAKAAQWFPTNSNDYHGVSTNVDHLVLKIACEPSPGLHKHFTLVIHSDLSYELKLALKHDEVATLEGIIASLTKAARTLSQLRQLLHVSYHVLPDPDLKLWARDQYSSNTRIYKLITLAITQSPPRQKTHPKLDNLRNIVQSKLLPYMGTIQTNDKGLLQLVYKRTSDFASDAGIQACLERMVAQRNTQGKPEPTHAEMADIVVQQFSLTEQESSRQVSMFEARKAGLGKLGPRGGYAAGRRNLSIKIRAHERTGFVMAVDVGTSQVSTKILARVHALVRYIVGRAGTSTKVAAAPGYMQMPSEGAMGAISPVNSAKASPMSQLEDGLDGIDDGDVDAEFEKMLLELAAGQAAPNAKSPVADQVEEDDTNAPHRHLLNRLYSADKRLFDTQDKVFSRTCQLASGRQPIVVSDGELNKIRSDHPGAFTDSIKYGSDVHHQNNYICPRIWCPKSRLALTRHEYERLGGKCPPMKVGDKLVDVGETAIIQDSANYWGDGDRPRYIGFLAPNKHPEGLCMPCCFATSQQKWKKCVKVPDANADVGVADEDVQEDAGKKKSERSNNKRYLIDYDGRQTENGRFSLLPRPLARFLNVPGFTRCGGRPNGAGLITVSTKGCFARVGMPETRQPLLESAAQIFGTQGGASGLIESIVNNLTPLEFIGLNGGAMTRIFAPEDVQPSIKGAGITKQLLQAFVQWVKKHRIEYFERLGIHDVADAIMRCKTSIEDAGEALRREVLREYIVYRAFQSFRSYMVDPQARKGHELLLDLLNMRRPWINPTGINVAILDVDDVGAAYVACPLFRSAQSLYDPKGKWAFMIRHGGRQVYEPIALVSVIGKKGGEVDITYAFKGTDLPKQLMTAMEDQQSKCIGGASTKAEGAGIVPDIIAALAEQGMLPRSAVIGPDFRVTGLLAEDRKKNTMYIPLPVWESLLRPHIWSIGSFVHVERVYTSLVHKIKPAAAQIIFAALEAKFKGSEFYKVTGVSKGSLQLSGGVTVPLPGPFPEGAKEAVDDTNIFIGLALVDSRVAYMSQVEAMEALRAWYRTEILAAISQSSSLQEQILYIRHPNNPFPVGTRRDKAMALLEPVIKLAIVKQKTITSHNEVIGGLSIGTACASVRKKPICQANQPRCMWVNASAKGGKSRCMLQVHDKQARLLAEQFVDELLLGEEIATKDTAIDAYVRRRGHTGSAIIVTDADIATAQNDIVRMLETIRGMQHAADKFALNN